MTMLDAASLPWQQATLPTSTPTSHTWLWRGYPIRYQQAGTSGSAVVLIHGFGASSDHWRKNLPVLAEHHRVFAIDLLGFGFSAKPKPSPEISYTFETWGQQILDFIQAIVTEPAFLVGNSVGCVAAMQAAVCSPSHVLGVALLNCSLRLLHERKRQDISWHERLSALLLQAVLGIRPIGHFFFSQIANSRVIRRLLLQAYHNPEAVTDELVNLILAPALTPGAADVFLAFIAYSQGPLPEDLLPQLQCPVLMVWGAADPWEPIAKGQHLGTMATVTTFIPLEGVGHCPQDEAPHLVNPILESWLSSPQESVDVSALGS